MGEHIILDKDFLLRAQSFQQTITPMEVFRFLLGVGVVVAVFFLRKTIVENLLKTIHSFDGLSKEEQQKNDKQLSGPLSFLAVLVSIFIFDVLVEFPPDLELFHEHAQFTLLNVFVFWGVFMAIEPVSRFIYQTGTHTFGDEVREITVKVLKLLALVVGFLSVLQAWGVNVGAFLAGLGLIGMAVALAAGDTMKNFFGSVVVLADHIFSKGDWVKTPQVEGIIEKFGLRTTTIRGFDDSEIHIPNATLADTTITNFSRCRVRKVEMTLPIGCPVSEEALKKIVRSYKEYLDHHDMVCHDKVIICNLDKFGENCVEFFIYFFTTQVAWIPFMEFKQKVLLDFKRLAQEAGVGFGVPTRLVLLHQNH